MVQAIATTNTNLNSNNAKWKGQHATRNGFSTPETVLPAGNRNYCLFNETKVSFFAARKENSLPYVANVLKTSTDEKEIVETLCIVDRMADNGTKGIYKIYPLLAKFNDTESPNIQTYLAGIYRKILVPDAFGPLCSMLIKNSTKPSEQNSQKLFDPNEEIGGAILEYIRKWSQPADPKDFLKNCSEKTPECKDSKFDCMA